MPTNGYGRAGILKQNQLCCPPLKMVTAPPALLRPYSRAMQQAADGKTCSNKNEERLDETGSIYTAAFTASSGKSITKAESTSNRYCRARYRQLSRRCSLQAVDAGRRIGTQRVSAKA